METRLIRLKEWVYQNLCKGREMKTIPADGDYTRITRQEPRVFLGFTPTRPNKAMAPELDPVSVAPSILIMPDIGYGKCIEEKRFDRFNNVHRTQEYGQWLNVSMLFSVYEPGIRLPGFADGTTGKEIDVRKIIEGTEEGLLTLMGWMDDGVSALLASKVIPHTDLTLDDSSLTYSLYKDQNTVVDKRPMFYGFVEAKFICYANDTGKLNQVDQLL